MPPVSLSELSVCLVATRDIDNPHVMPLIPGRGNVRFYYTLTRLAPSNVQPLVTLHEDTFTRSRSILDAKQG